MSTDSNLVVWIVEPFLAVQRDDGVHCVGCQEASSRLLRTASGTCSTVPAIAIAFGVDIPVWPGGRGGLLGPVRSGRALKPLGELFFSLG